MSGNRGDLGAFATADADGTDRVVCHVDMDCFYAACERLREPALQGEPVVVGMGYESGETHGAVATASYEAREFGVESAMAISEALELLARKVEAARNPAVDVDEAGFYRPVDLDYYQDVGSEVKAVLHERADAVREVSVDEAYLDVTDRVDWADPAGVRDYAAGIKTAIEREVGVVASVGAALIVGATPTLATTPTSRSMAVLIPAA